MITPHFSAWSPSSLSEPASARDAVDIEQWSRARAAGTRALDAIGSADGPPLSSRATRLLTAMRERLDALRDLEPTALLSELFDRALEDTGYLGYFESGDEEAMSRWENLQQLRSNIERFDDEPPETRLTTFLSEVALVSDADTIEDAHEKVTSSRSMQ